MIPIRIVETEREDFDEPVVELWMDKEFVGMVFWDGSSTIVQIYPAGDEDVHDLEMRDLFRALEMAERIVDPLAFDQVEGLVQLGGGRAQAKREEPEDDWSEEDPSTVELLSEFDPLAAFRSEDGEGFFPKDVAERFVRRCLRIDPQDLAEPARQVESVTFGVAAGAAVTEADVQHLIGAERQLAAVVVAVGLVDGEDLAVRILVERAGTGVEGELGHHGVAVEVGEVDIG